MILHPAFIAFVALNLMDAITTAYALKHGGRELNPFLKSLITDGEEPWEILLVVKAMLCLIVFFLFPHIPVLGRDALVCVMAGVVVWNLVQLSRNRP